MTTDRIDYLEYLSMTLPTSIAFVLRAPPISYVSNIYYLPFSTIVWICSILLVILCTCVIALTLKFRFQSGETSANLTVSDFILFAIASSCQMGSEIMSKMLSARLSMVGVIIISSKEHVHYQTSKMLFISVCIFHSAINDLHLIYR